MNEFGKLVVISGFSGSGKGTIIKALLENYSNDYVLSVSATSRLPREGEEEGVHYFFKTRTEFESMIQNRELIEYAEYVGNYYGTPKKYVEEMLSQGKNVILEIEVQGGSQIKKLYPEALMMFIMPPSVLELKQRLLNRGSESEEVIQHRLAQANKELEYISGYDYMIINRELEEAVETLHVMIKSSNEEREKQDELKVKNKTQFLDGISRDLSLYQ